MNSKAKGSAGERELCVWLTAHGYPARRNEQRYIGGKGNADVVAEGLERLNVPAAMQQAERDADGRIPAVVHRRNREPWLITMHLEDWIKGQSP